MPKRPVASTSTEVFAPLEELPSFDLPQHPPLCNVHHGEPCDCGIADARPAPTSGLLDAAYADASLLPARPKADVQARTIVQRSNGRDDCGATSPWMTHCVHEIEHNGSHSWQDQDRFPVVPADVGGGSLAPLKDAEEVFAPRPAIREVNGKWTAIELPGTSDKQPKGTTPMTSTATVVQMSATLKRLGYKSGTQADPDAYVEMVIRTNDLSVGAELGWQTGRTLTVTMQPEQPRLATGTDEQD